MGDALHRHRSALSDLAAQGPVANWPSLRLGRLGLTSKTEPLAGDGAHARPTVRLPSVSRSETPHIISREGRRASASPYEHGARPAFSLSSTPTEALGHCTAWRLVTKPRPVAHWPSFARPSYGLGTGATPITAIDVAMSGWRRLASAMSASPPSMSPVARRATPRP